MPDQQRRIVPATACHGCGHNPHQFSECTATISTRHGDIQCPCNYHQKG